MKQNPLLRRRTFSSAEQQAILNIAAKEATTEELGPKKCDTTWCHHMITQHNITPALLAKHVKKS